MLWMGEWPRKPTLGQQDINWIYMEIASLVFYFANAIPYILYFMHAIRWV